MAQVATLIGVGLALLAFFLPQMVPATMTEDDRDVVTRTLAGIGIVLIIGGRLVAKNAGGERRSS